MDEHLERLAQQEPAIAEVLWGERTIRVLERKRYWAYVEYPDGRRDWIDCREFDEWL